jgi:GntR family transcriptional regulator, arabinose operon transcriptional repressor
MGQPKHAVICDEIRRAITSGRYQEGQRLPTEAELVKQYDTSRPTVARALRDLQYEGLIARRAGSGTFVRRAGSDQGHVFGLVIPGLGETEIFEPICREMARTTQEAHHALLWASTNMSAYSDMAEQAWQSAQQCIARRVAGVFFAPLELTPNGETTNERIVQALDAARVPIVLLDRDLYRHPRRSRYDRVGIDNRMAGFTLTDHLLKLGCRKIGFFSRPCSAETVFGRLSGYREALDRHSITPQASWQAEGEPSDADFVRKYLQSSSVEAVVCANDITAANLMRTMDLLDIKTPQTVRIVGVDDVKYASLLRVPLTTLHQPCQHIGAAAVRALTERISNPDLPARDILFQSTLVVRESCGARLNGAKSPRTRF